ncbi:MAG TPA: TPM domain-containing protein [Candidatus Polarisedimenticolia bacterium]|nr:TPM domain-containing protein [Candidatus Polarisedimenticolia bacterium]
MEPAAARVVLPPPAGLSVHDLAGVISPEQKAIMERRHTDLFARTGVAIVVLTVPRLDDETIGDLAVRTGTEWGVGRKHEDRGLVVALETEHGHVFIAAGYGVEGYLPDGRLGSILDRDVVPWIKRQDYSTAMFQASAALVEASAREFGVTVDGLGGGAAERRGEGPSVGGMLMLVLLGILALVMMIRHPWLFWLLMSSSRQRGGGWGGGGFGGGFGGGSGFGGFGGGGFGGGGAGR